MRVKKKWADCIAYIEIPFHRFAEKKLYQEFQAHAHVESENGDASL